MSPNCQSFGAAALLMKRAGTSTAELNKSFEGGIEMYKTSDYVIDRLIEWGVQRVFGYPGDAVNPLITAIGRANQKIDFVQARHEEMCAFMACAHAKFTGEIGVCLSTAGPGAIHLLNGLYDAKMDNQPVIAIVGQQPRHALGSSFLQDVDLSSLFKDVAHEYVNVAMTAEQVRHLLDRSIRTAYAERSVTCLVLPHDIQNEKAEPNPKREHGQSFSGSGYALPHVVPAREDLLRAADVLNAGQRVAMLIGAGALSARDEIVETAEILGAGVAKALLGKAALEDDLPYVTGSIGMLGTEASWNLMNNCDTLFVVGSNFPYAEFLPAPGVARGVQIDLKAQNLSLRYPVEVGLLGESACTLRELIPLLERKTDRAWRERVQEMVHDSDSALEAQANVPGRPVNPQKVFRALSGGLPERSIITADSGTSTVWFARHLRMRRDMMASVSGGLASMGCSIPYAIAAKFAHPDRPVVACSGDGAMQMIGNNELITLAKYWKDWLDPRFIVLVLKNNDLNFVTWEMRVTEGDPRFVPAQEVPDFDYAEYAKSLGLFGFKITSESEIANTLQLALGAQKPVVIEIQSDPNIPPIPPHVNADQAASFASALAKGESEASKPFWGAFSQVWHSIFHR